MIYLDYAATTPISDNALQVFTEVSKNYFGNTSSLHDEGTNAKTLLEHCRSELAAMIGAAPKSVYFTSGGTESNVLAVKTLLLATKKRGKHIITSAIEHSSLLNYFAYLEQEHGYAVTYLPVDEYGTIRIDQLVPAITAETVLVSIQHANSEIGVIQPIEAIGKLLDGQGILFHSDCVQTFGKLPIDVKALQVDSISISSHKIYGPKGVGAAFINPALFWSNITANSNQENGFRAGTVNLPGIAAFVTAAQEVTENRQKEQTRLAMLRTILLQQLTNREVKAEKLTSPNHLPHIIGLLVGPVQGDYAMLEFNRAGIAISTGSACSIGEQEPSKTIVALGKSPAEAKQFIRLSLGKQTTKADMEKTANVLKEIMISYQKGKTVHE